MVRKSGGSDIRTEVDRAEEEKTLITKSEMIHESEVMSGEMKEQLV